MDRPTKITVIEKNDGYEIICMDEMSGSSIGVDLPVNGYKALAEHFKTGAMEISSDELGNCNKPHVSPSLIPIDETFNNWRFNYSEFGAVDKGEDFKKGLQTGTWAGYNYARVRIKNNEG